MCTVLKNVPFEIVEIVDLFQPIHCVPSPAIVDSQFFHMHLMQTVYCVVNRELV